MGQEMIRDFSNANEQLASLAGEDVTGQFLSPNVDSGVTAGFGHRGSMRPKRAYTSHVND